jgi:glycosyltransferase involved in cell wall biosynthesis
LSEAAPSGGSFSAHLRDVQESVEIDAWMPPLPRELVKGAAARVSCLRQSIERAETDWLYVPSADGVSQVMGARRTLMLPTLPRGLRGAEGLMLRSGHAYPHLSSRGAWKARMSWAVARRAPWDVLHLLDPLAYEPILRRGGALARWCRPMPDPVEIPDSFDKRAARTRLGIPTDGRYVGCFGMIHRGKGADLLIRAFADADLPTQDRLLLAGPQERYIRELLASDEYCALVHSGRIISIDRGLRVEELMNALTATDLAATLYQGHTGSVSIAIRAAAARRPVLAHAAGWLANVVPRFALGWTCDATDPQALKSAIAASLDTAAEWQPAEPVERFVQFHRAENFRASWTWLLRQRLGLPQSPVLRDWQWVLDRAPAPAPTQAAQVPLRTA